MKSFAVLAGGLCAGLVAAAPLAERQAANIDPVVLNFALTLEHLENAFYKGALKNFTKDDFAKAGYSPTYYNNLMQIAYDEEQHVKLLTGALQAAGVTPVAACQYSFPYTDVASFITLSSVLEGVGTSAYLGGAPLITDKGYLTVAGSILVTEALHTSYQRAAKGEIPFPTPYGTPLDPTSVYTLAAAFIVSCPSTNPALPFTPFPGLTYDATSTCTCEGPDCAPSAAIKRDNDWGSWPTTTSSMTPEAMKTTMTSMASPSVCTKKASPEKGSSSYPPPPPPPATTTPAAMTTKACSTATVTVTASGPSGTWAPWSGPSAGSKACAPPSAGATVKFTAAKPVPAGSYLTFVSGLTVTSVKGTISGSDISAAIPAGIAGQVYVLVSKVDQEKALDDTQVLFGPAIIEVNPAPVTLDYSYIKA